MRHEVPSQGTHPGLLPQLPSFSVQFPDETLRSGELLNMIVAVIDSAQVHKGLASREAWAAGHPPPRPHTCVHFRPGGWKGNGSQGGRQGSFSPAHSSSTWKERMKMLRPLTFPPCAGPREAAALLVRCSHAEPRPHFCSSSPLTCPSSFILFSLPFSYSHSVPGLSLSGPFPPPQAQAGQGPN